MDRDDHIYYVMPGDLASRPNGAREIERRQALLQSWAFPGTRVTAIDVRNGILSIESSYDEMRAAPAGVAKIEELERAGAAAAVIGCFGDPGIEAARERVSMPVVGPGQASLLLAASLGNRIGLLSVFDSLAAMHRTQAFRAGVLDKLCSIRPTGIPVLELSGDPDATLGRLAEVGTAARDVDGADVLILGCMTLAFLDMAPRLSEALGVPVINPAQAGLKAAEVYCAMKLMHAPKIMISILD